MELLYLENPNAVRYTLPTGTCLLLAGDLGHGLTIGHDPSTANTWAQCLIVLITTDIYWNSAWQKLRSPQFRSGLYSTSGSTPTPRSVTSPTTGSSRVYQGFRCISSVWPMGFGWAVRPTPVRR